MLRPPRVFAASILALACTSSPPAVTDAGTAWDLPVLPEDLPAVDAGRHDAPLVDRPAADTSVSDLPAPQDAPPPPCRAAEGAGTADTSELVDNGQRARVVVQDPSACLRTYALSSTATLRDGRPGSPRMVSERASWPTVRTRNDLFDALYALAVEETRENGVEAIRDGAFDEGRPYTCPTGGCFETGRLWTYAWTRDTAYSVDLGLGAMDPVRARNSLEFKLSERRGGGATEFVQDTGTGGSWPVSSDRVVWALGAGALLNHLDGDARAAFRDRSLDAMTQVIERDRAVIYDPGDGLYTGEQSFLDWREQSYPGWTAQDASHIAMSKSLSTNVLHFVLLRTASELATERGDAERATRWRQWSDALRESIRQRFWDADARQFRAFITTTLDPSAVRRWDLLGTSLAVLHGIATPEEARDAVARYPHAGAGPAVLWPQQQRTAIYHNRGSWPFVTAYLLRAARQVRNDAVVNRDLRELMRGAALNLSNMENFEFLSGAAWVSEGDTSGPVVNSQRQLWSVAGYLSMVHDVVFGMESSSQGLRFRPYVTKSLRNTLFANADTLVLNDLRWRGRSVSVTVRLPPRGTDRAGAYAVGAVRVDGRDLGEGWLTASTLAPQAHVEVTLEDRAEPASPIAVVADERDWRQIFGPQTPEIRDLAPSANGASLVLRWSAADEAAGMTFNVIRDGQVIARDLPGSTVEFTDPMSADHPTVTRCYTVEAVFTVSGNASQHAAPRCYWGPGAQRVRSFAARDFSLTGGRVVDSNGRTHTADWGDPGHRLEVGPFTAAQAGEHLVQLVAANGSNGFTTGITCAVKRVDVIDVATGMSVGGGYVAMPQTGGWDAWRDSTFARVRLQAGASYRVVISQDERAVNMSAFAHFARYTGGTGGSSGAFNRADIAEVKVLAMGR
ncbi:MAG: hypothetical protein R3A48_26995 [Polyangiales bacterium]